MHDGIVYKILTQTEFEAFRSTGELLGVGSDVADGFVHLSSAAQVNGTVEAYFKDRSDLCVVAVDASVLGEALRWEASRGGALFPHLYGVLPYRAVLAVSPLARGRDGGVMLP
jgi:uncharacterized protein (DUF952 family)